MPESRKTAQEDPTAKITVSVRAYGELRDLVKETTIELPRGATVKDFFARLGKKNPEFASEALNEDNQPLPNLIVVLNLANIESAEGLNIILSDGDTVGIIPPVIGGTRISVADEI